MNTKMGRIIVPDHEKWMDEVRVGDILLERGEKPRIVRYLKEVNGHNYYFGFAIKRCSWTRHCGTTLLRGDLRSRGFKPSGQRVEQMDLLDKYIALEFNNTDHTRRQQNRRKIYSWDVVGVKI